MEDIYKEPKAVARHCIALIIFPLMLIDTAYWGSINVLFYLPFIFCFLGYLLRKRRLYHIALGVWIYLMFPLFT